MHREKKIDFLKEKGACFGCSKTEHMSKDCERGVPVTCGVCNQSHSEIPHVGQKNKEKKPEHTEQSNAVLSPHIYGLIWAGDENSSSILPGQVKSYNGLSVAKVCIFGLWGLWKFMFLLHRKVD